MRARRYGSASARSGHERRRRAAHRPRGGAGRTPPATSTASTIEREHDRGVEVGLAHHEDAEHRRARAAPGAPPGASRASSPARRLDEVGGVEQQRELRELARLEPEHPGAEPAARPDDVDADAGDEHDDEQHHADDEQRADQRAPACGSRSATRRRTRRCRGPSRELAEEEVPRRAVVGERRHRRRREHHHHADDVEHADGRDEQQRGRRPASRAPASRLAARVPRDGGRATRGSAIAVMPIAPFRHAAASSAGRHLAREVVAALGVARVPVERRARGRQQHGVAGAARARPRRAPRRASTRRARPAPRRRTPPRPRRRPRRSRRPRAARSA